MSEIHEEMNRNSLEKNDCIMEESVLKAMPLEETFEELDRLIEIMQAPDMSLEKTFECYKRGLILVQACNDKIEKVECDIKRVTDNE